MDPIPRSTPQHTHLHHDHHAHAHAHPTFAPPFPGTALVLGVGGRIALAVGAATLLWITVGWALA